MRNHKQLRSLITEALSSPTLPEDIEAFLDGIAKRGQAVKGDPDGQFAILDELRPIRREFIAQKNAAEQAGDYEKAGEIEMMLDELTSVVSIDVFGYRRATPEIWWAGIRSGHEGT